jgi:hypothetical protein
MRRSLVVAAVAAALVLSSPGSGSAEEPGTPERALSTVQGLLDQPQGGVERATNERPDLSLALRDLFVAMPRLDAADRRTARAIFARPTDGAADPVGDGYTVPAKKRCGTKLCVHWVDSTADAPPGRAWVRTNLEVISKVWRIQVGKLGYRKPIGDKRKGGNAKLDVYLKELGDRGIYGYCMPERKVRNHKWLASGYCVLDNDFAEAQFGAPPMRSLRVTAAHEFFHAVQFAYDYGEDPWLMEATATWMEERVADNVNDNRQYLPYGQIGNPGRPLDTFNRDGFNQYGNWAFFEYLSGRFGAGIVRQIWSSAGAYPGSGHRYSTTAVKGALAGKRGGFTDVFRRFAAANTAPARTYPEGGRWPVAPASASWTLTADARKQSTTTRIDHMASRNYVVRPGDGIGGKGWRLRVRVDGPGRKAAPAAYLVVKRKQGLVQTPIGLSEEGRGATTISFNGTRVSWAKVVVVNASTRFSCWHRTSWSCQGRARDNDLKFALSVAAVRARR